MIRIVIPALCMVVLALSASTVGATDTSPGKSSVFASGYGFTLAEFPGNTLSGTISKGKKKTVLVIHTMIHSTPGVPVHLIGTVSVNGQPTEPKMGLGGFISGQDCRANNSIGCTLTDVRWFDIDAAEAANPGAFVGLPLVIDFSGGVLNGAGAGAIGFSSMTVQVQKK
jgi:hypothetical protein